MLIRRIARGTAKDLDVAVEIDRFSRGFAMVTERMGVADAWVKIARGDAFRIWFHLDTGGRDIMVLTLAPLQTAGGAGFEVAEAVWWALAVGTVCDLED